MALKNRIKKLELLCKPLDTTNLRVEDMSDEQLWAVMLDRPIEDYGLSKEEQALLLLHKHRSIHFREQPETPFTVEEKRMIESIMDRIIAS